jgi:signal transduction histidine kinase
MILQGTIMNNSTAVRLKEKIPHIMKAWENRAKNEILAALHMRSLALRDSLPEYLMGLVEALDKNIDRTTARKRHYSEEGSRIGKIHGGDRAKDSNYTIDQLIFEYHILRQVIFDELEEEENVGSVEREVIICSIEQAVNDAATHFSFYKEEAIKLAEALKVRDEFLSIASHELKTPISSLKLQLEMVFKNIVQNKSGSTDKEVLKKAFENSIRQVNKLTKLVEDVLDVSSIHLGRLKISRESGVNLSSLIQEVATQTKELGVSSIGSTISINFLLPPTPIIGTLDSSRIGQVITNLVSNAIKYGGNKISIELKKISENEVEISVEDNGRGISVKDQERIFHEFERVGSNVNKAGLGLGLYISNQIILAHSGSIKVESSAGIGSKFIIRLPI